MKDEEINAESILNLKKELEFRKYELEIAKLKVQNAEMVLEMEIQNKMLHRTVKVETALKEVKHNKSNSFFMEIISENYRIPLENEDYMFKMAKDILNDLIIEKKIKINDKLNFEKTGICMSKLGFKKTAKRIGNSSRYGYAVVKKGGQS